MSVPVWAWGTLTATAISETQIRLSWPPSGDSFTVQRLSGCCTWVVVGGTDLPVHTWTDTGLTPATSYTYRVLKYIDGVSSGYSNLASASTVNPNASALTVSYEYDPFDNLIKTTAGNVVTTLGYDLRGRKISMSDPNMGPWTYAYDALSELIRQVDAKSSTTTMSYDLLGRMVSRSEPDLNSNWYYDTLDGTPGGTTCGTGGTTSKGKLCKAAAANGYVRTQSYDSFGRPYQSTTTIDTAYTIQTSYDSYGRVDTVTYPTGFKTQNVYNAQGYLASVRNADVPSTVYWTATSVSASGRVLAETLDSAISTTRTFDPLDRMLTVSTTGGAGTVQNDTWTYDLEGNVTQRADLQLTENFTYDSRNRLTGSSGSGLVTKTIDYASIGNITYKSDVGAYTYGSQPHAVASIAGTVNTSFSYDANGNLTSGNGRTFTYMSYNMPWTITSGSYTYTYAYSPEHQRVKLVHSTLGTFVYLNPPGGSGLFYEKQIYASGLVEHKHYINGSAGPVGVYLMRSDSTTEMRYFLKDNLNSVQAITTSTGSALESLAYDAFGKRRFTNGTDDPNNTIVPASSDRGFSSHEHLDEIALIHMNGRIYDPAIGRFTSADPTITDPRNLQSFNRFSYTLNNPLRLVDPSGYGGQEPVTQKIDGGSVPQISVPGSACQDGVCIYRDPDTIRQILQDLQKQSPGATAYNPRAPYINTPDALAVARAPGKPTLLIAFGLPPASTSDDANNVNTSIQRWWAASVGGFQSESFSDFINRALQAFPADNALLAVGIPAVTTGASLIGQSFGKLGTVVAESGLSIQGFVTHGIDQAITRGVSPAAMFEAVQSPLAVLDQGGGTFLHIGEQAAVVLNDAGLVVTTYPARMYDATVQAIVDVARALRGGM